MGQTGRIIENGTEKSESAGKNIGKQIPDPLFLKKQKAESHAHKKVKNNIVILGQKTQENRDSKWDQKTEPIIIFSDCPDMEAGT